MAEIKFERRELVTVLGEKEAPSRHYFRGDWIVLGDDGAALFRKPAEQDLTAEEVTRFLGEGYVANQAIIADLTQRMADQRTALETAAIEARTKAKDEAAAAQKTAAQAF